MNFSNNADNGVSRLVRQVGQPFIGLITSWLLAFSVIAAPLTEWTLSDSQGMDIRFPEHAEGAPAVVYFWATWCPYCRALTPKLAALQKEFDHHGVKIYAISMEEDQDPYAQMVPWASAGFVVLGQGDFVAEDYGVQGVPDLYIIDQCQNTVYRRQNTTSRKPEGVAEELRVQVREVLEGLLQSPAQCRDS